MAALRRIVGKARVRRHHLAAARMCCERNVLAISRRTPGDDRPRILAYHAVGTPYVGNNDVAPDRFRRQLESALRAGYTFVPASDIADGQAPRRSLAVTFDDGIRSAATTAAPVLAELGIPWTLFVVSGWADGDAHDWAGDMLMDWKDVDRLASQGVRIGSHSVTHPNFSRLGTDETEFELEESRRVIESRLGVKVEDFAIPMGQSCDWTQHAATASKNAGYVRVYSQAEDTRFPGTIARTFVTRWDNGPVFRAALTGAYAGWEEWY
ncbi:polysaccharide deacetylase family protein [Candidatus Mycolicibacterium alkanivorans]|uniref:Polysaccharide deacetylase family protein n=1 Tax=Candidatus Mycolicibacterium alkanivorans TaxID=2954114 RepID=A0ABS9YXC6_9MYCO|nr:polysaccharide deacetylase family protein [Candidatus Mycolicibacterium alkanivorans]MCI4675897.1 polysaccharide deacetylase family protein [Candidatus Mycolicibacterium alkanivorans]